MPLHTWRTRVSNFMSRLRGHAVLPPNVTVGRNVHIGSGTSIDWSHGHHVEIGDDAVLAPGVRVIAHDASSRIAAGLTYVAPVRIGKGAFIGAQSILLPGVTVGDGAIVGAGSVVTRSVSAGEVVAGSPARVIGSAQDLHARRTQQAAELPVLSEAVYNAHPLTQDRVRYLTEVAAEHGGYFLSDAEQAAR